MASDDPSQAFKDSRASLRDTAKWVISGSAAVILLIVGSSTISQLGTLGLADVRFWVAIFGLGLAAVLWWIPFQRSVAVLRSEQLSLRAFRASIEPGRGGGFGAKLKTGAAPDPLLEDAMKAASALLDGQLPRGTLAAFIDYYEQRRTIAIQDDGPEVAAPPQSKGQVPKGIWAALGECLNAGRKTPPQDDADPEPTPAAEPTSAEAARKELADLAPLYDFCGQVCITELVSLRFDRLMSGLRLYVPIIIAGVLMFAWAANPPKETVKLADKSVLDPLVLRTPSVLASLTAGGVAQACIGAGAEVVTLATGPKNTAIDLLVPPPAATGCSPRRLTLSGGQLVGLD